MIERKEAVQKLQTEVESTNQQKYMRDVNSHLGIHEILVVNFTLTNKNSLLNSDEHCMKN